MSISRKIPNYDLKKKIRTLRDDLFSSLFKTYSKWKIKINYDIQARNIEKIIIKNRNKIDLEENYRQLGMPKCLTSLNVR